MTTVELTEDVIAATQTPSSMLASDHAQRVPDQLALGDALDRLPHHLRAAVLVSAHNSGSKPISYRKLARLLGISDKTARSHHEEGLRRLRLILTTAHEDHHAR